MKLNQIDPQKILNPAFRIAKIDEWKVEDFTQKLADCIQNIRLIDERNESEEHLKAPISKFLSSTFYANNEVNTKNSIDLAVYLGKDMTSDVGIILEAKKPSNKAEFPTPENLNKKAFQELLLYYLRERYDAKNNNIKHLIITNGYEWFFFKSEDFRELFYKDKNLLKEYTQFRDGLKDSKKTELFYSEIAPKYIAENEKKIPFVYLDFRKEEVQKLSPKKRITLYKLFSDVHLLGKSFGNDSNELNKDFYNELLHIIGLEEVKDAGKKIIKRKEKDRDFGSLLESTIFKLEDQDYLSKVKDVPNDNQKSFHIGLELCLNWVNRILFLKLLESQLLGYNENNEDYKFLNINFIKDYDSLNDLFFSALARPVSDRHPRFAEKFQHIPYLNSSLFERTTLEDKTFAISGLTNERMDIYSATVLKDANGKKRTGKLDTLEYLFLFLDAYDFSTEASSEQNTNGKTLINASVLGLIFEKINGYKDGSFYTPGFITMFMCRETLRKAVVDKFKKEVEQSIDTFDDVRSYCKSFFKQDKLKEFNQLINSIRICDPAVGSGHFLVSALNEMIAIKSELGILCDEEFITLPCEIQIENDELYILNANGELFEYQRKDPNSLRIQKAIFHNKEQIIENCLFGVDLNPNSVNICRLRLWIELLKNAYYTQENELQTLPNIDINIKCGNSLVSRFTLEDSLQSAFKDQEYSIEDYKNAVKEYKSTNSKDKKREVEEIISNIKNNFRTTLDNNFRAKISKAVGDYENENQRQHNLVAFGNSITKKEKDQLKKLKQKAEQAQKEKEEILGNIIYKNAFEWRFEFPEVLDDEGNFIGFDVIVGNPPYIQLQKMGEMSSVLEKQNYETYARTGDIYALFYELGRSILKSKGLLSFITSNKWMRAAYGELLRKFFIEKTNPILLIDFGGIQIFDSATVDTNILTFVKENNTFSTQACVVKEKVLKNLSDYFRQNATFSTFSDNESWVILSEIEQRIKEKIEAVGTPLKDWDIQINYGIKTGFNEAFIINGEKRKELIEADPKSEEIIRPILRGRDIKRYGYDFADLYLIFIPWHFPLHENPNIVGASKEAEQAFENQYPSIYNHLLKYKKELSNRNKAETGIRYEWYALQRWGANYWEEFYKQKIVWLELTDKPKFSLDENYHLCLAGTFLLTSKELINTIMCCLNSKLVEWLFDGMCNSSGVGTNQWKKFVVEKIPIPKTNIMEEKLSILLKSNDYDEIDKLIYQLYNLTDEEIMFIEKCAI